jgi:uncharacterized membrane protein YGL010W
VTTPNLPTLIALNSTIWGTILLKTIVLRRLVVVTLLVAVTVTVTVTVLVPVVTVRCRASVAGGLATLGALYMWVWSIGTTESCKMN